MVTSLLHGNILTKIVVHSDPKLTILIYLSGDSGVGKTTLVNLISNTNSKPSWTVGCNVEVIYHESRGL